MATNNLNYGCHEWLPAFEKAPNAKLSCPEYLSASWHPCVLAHLYACKQLNNEHMTLHPRPPLPPFSKAGPRRGRLIPTRLGMVLGILLLIAARPRRHRGRRARFPAAHAPHARASQAAPHRMADHPSML